MTAYPDPFHPVTNIVFQVERAAELCIKVYDLMGSLIHTEQLGYKHPGQHEFALNLADKASGKYFVRVTDGDQTIGTIVTLLR